MAYRCLRKRSFWKDSGATTLRVKRGNDPGIARLQALTEHVDYIEKERHGEGAFQEAAHGLLIQRQQAHIGYGPRRGGSPPIPKDGHFPEGFEGAAFGDAFIAAVNRHAAFEHDVEIVARFPLAKDYIAPRHRFHPPQRYDMFDGIGV